MSAKSAKPAPAKKPATAAAVAAAPVAAPPPAEPAAAEAGAEGVEDAEEMERRRREKLERMQASAGAVRIGGKGTARRKKKVLHKLAAGDDKKLQASLKKLNMNTITGIEEVNMFKENGEVIHLNNPKVQASLQSNAFAINGHAETKQFSESPQMWMQAGTECLMKLLQSGQLGKMAGMPGMAGRPGAGGRLPGLSEAVEGRVPQAVGEADEDEVPELVGTFEDAAAASK